MKEYTTEMAADTIPHHPYFLRWIKRPDGKGVRFEHQPFTGAEPEPQTPSYAELEGLDADTQQLVWDEYEILRRAWALARWRNDLKALLATAAPVWPAIDKARTAMTDAYEALRCTTDGWHAAVLRLVEAQDEALAAARRWDEVAGPLATHRYVIDSIDSDCHSVAEMETVAVEQGVTGTGDWHIDDDHDAYRPSSYRPDSPMVRLVRSKVDRQRVTLRQVSELTGGDPGFVG